jgi:branched-chain amino acid transport system permease protein
MSIFLQLLLNGLIAGAIYSMIAVGFSLIYSTNKFVHFAHGCTVAASAYIAYFLFSMIGLDFFLSAILAILFSGLLGYLVYIFVYSPLLDKKASGLILLTSSVGLMIFLESMLLLLFGADVKVINFIKVEKGLDFFGAIITPLQIVIVFFAIASLVSVYLFMKKTNLGKAMRAVSDNKDVAEVCGISSRKIFAYSFIIGSLLAGLAGILIGLEQNLEPTMGTNLMIKGFTGTIIGGITSVPGAILGSFLLGLAENFGIWYLPSGYKDAISFAILFAFLLIRPQGILGTKNILGK